MVQQRGQILIMLRDMFCEQPFQFALAMRFLPQPTGLSNVFLGVIDIPIWIIQLTTFLGCTIRLCSSVYLGASARTVSDVLYGDREWNWITILPFVFGLIGVVLGAAFMVSVSRRVMKQLEEHKASMDSTNTDDEVELEVISVEIVESENAGLAGPTIETSSKETSQECREEMSEGENEL